MEGTKLEKSLEWNHENQPSDFPGFLTQCTTSFIRMLHFTYNLVNESECTNNLST